MPQAVTHILIPILIVSIFRDFYLKKNQKAHFPLHYVLIAGIGGVLPDIDIILSFMKWFVNPETWWIHKTFTHSIFFPISLLILFSILRPVHPKIRMCKFGKHKLDISTIFLILSFGALIHLILDTVFGNQSFLFYPFSDLDFGLDLISKYTPFNWGTIMATLDGVLLVLWIVYLEVKHKISDFI